MTHVAKILKTVDLRFRVDITESADSFNGVVSQGEEFICGVAVGLHKGVDAVVTKATAKLNHILSANDNEEYIEEDVKKLIRKDLRSLQTAFKKKPTADLKNRISEIQQLLK